jgi:ABC-type phosphate transport system substrate-binding protein
MRLLVFLVLLLAAAGARAEALLVIANPQVQAESVSSDELGDIYLLRKVEWQPGLRIVPVNREAGSAERASFSEQVLGESPADLAEYWNRLRFEGKRPPLIQGSDQAVLGFVHNVPGAIGYVSARNPPQGVKVLLRLP